MMFLSQIQIFLHVYSLIGLIHLVSKYMICLIVQFFLIIVSSVFSCCGYPNFGQLLIDLLYFHSIIHNFLTVFLDSYNLINTSYINIPSFRITLRITQVLLGLDGLWRFELFFQLLMLTVLVNSRQNLLNNCLVLFCDACCAGALLMEIGLSTSAI